MSDEEKELKGVGVKVKKEQMLTATILNIQRMSTEDGPGIRTTVFFKGCPLACIWCHNPESIPIKPQVQWIETKCIGCNICIDVCPNNAISLAEECIIINRDLCEGCGTCAKECPTTAMEILGKPWELEALLNEVEKDRAYFENSGGGITVSGGDPAMQAEFVAEFLKGCKERCLHTTLDTCGSTSKKVLDALLVHTDLVLYDLKEIDPEKHKEFIKQGNERILENIKYIKEFMQTHKRPSDLWVRTPIIPGATATEENIKGIGAFIGEHLSEAVSRWELCSFNNLCKDKYQRLGLDWPFKNQDLITKAFMEHLTDIAKKSGVDPNIVIWTGATKVEEKTDKSPEEENTSFAW